MDKVDVDEQAVSDSMRGEGNAGVEATFGSLGLCDWLLTSCKAMGFRRPTPVQTHCIPSVSFFKKNSTPSATSTAVVIQR